MSQCWQCAAAEGRRCPEQALTTASAGHDACITWRHGNGSVLLQNVVMSASECSQERIQFWSKFVNLYYQTYGGSVRLLCQTVSIMILLDFGISVVVTLTIAMMGRDLTCTQFKYHQVFQTTIRLPFHRFPQDFHQHHPLNLPCQLFHINHSQVHKI